MMADWTIMVAGVKVIRLTFNSSCGTMTCIECVANMLLWWGFWQPGFQGRVRKEEGKDALRLPRKQNIIDLET